MNFCECCTSEASSPNRFAIPGATSASSPIRCGRANDPLTEMCTRRFKVCTAECTVGDRRI
jgi:hypothetical protein